MSLKGYEFAPGLQTNQEFPGEDAIDSMSADELFAWENRDVPSINRVSDAAERADEKQDVTTSLNFPLHWTSLSLSWPYLFDFSVACELLAPRPTT